MKTLLLALTLLARPLVGVADDKRSAAEKSEAKQAASMIPKEIAGKYAGGELVELRVRDRTAYLIKPAGAVDAQRRWCWEFPFWLGINNGRGAMLHRHYVEKLLAAGFHVAGVDVGPSCASPSAAKVCQEFYEQLVRDHRLHPKARIVGQSHGGLIAYGWAMRNPTCVSRIAGVMPATDFRSWPRLPSVISLPDKGLGYDLTVEELTRRTAEFNPIDNLAPLAKAGVKILHIHGDADTMVPLPENSGELARRYSALGGDAEIVVLPGLGHGGEPIYQSEALLQFLLAD
jgi:hypothetical protein